MDGRERLELPLGTVLYQTSGFISHIRVSRDGQRVAFADHPLYADDNGDLAVVDRAGKRTVLASGFQGLRGVGWSPDGSEVWFTANNPPTAGVSLRAATLDGTTRTLLSFPTDWRLLDVAADGRLLITSEEIARHVEVVREGTTERQELAGNFNQAIGTALSRDGRSVLITDQGAVRRHELRRRMCGRWSSRTPSGLATGRRSTFPPTAVTCCRSVYGPPSRMLILPVGAGETKELPNVDGLTIPVVSFVPGGRQVAFLGSKGTGALRGYLQDIAGGPARAFTGDGVNTSAFSTLPIRPDGSAAWLIGPDGQSALFPLAGGAPQPRSLAFCPPIRWSSGRTRVSRSNVAPGATAPLQIFRVDLRTGARAPFRDVHASQPAGVRLAQVLMTPEGKTMLHSYSQLLTNLYVVDGLAVAGRRSDHCAEVSTTAFAANAQGAPRDVVVAFPVPGVRRRKRDEDVLRDSGRQRGRNGETEIGNVASPRPIARLHSESASPPGE